MDDLLRDLAESTLTLEEALELIDTCDAVPGLGAADLPTCNTPDASSQATKSADEPTKPKKRVRNPQNDVRRRQRRKAERQQLKDQVQEYEALVERLKRCRQTQASGDDSVETRVVAQQTSWLHAAIEEERKRRQAERMNAKLKALLVERLHTTAVVRDALKKEKRLLSKIESTEGFIAPSRASKSSLLEADTSFSGLSGALQNVFDTTDTVFRSFPTSSFDSLQSISRVKQRDQTSGPCIELLTTTPLACDIETANGVLWGVIADKKWPADQNAFDLKAKESSKESMELKFSMGLEQSQLNLDGATLLQRKDEEDRTVIAWTSVIYHASEQLRFQSQGWIVVLRSPTNPHAASSIQTCCRISATDVQLLSSSSMDLQNSILRSMGHRVKSRIEGVQQSLVEKAGSPGCAGLIFI